MTLVRPVRARVVTPQWAARVVSPLRDVLTEGERRAMLAANPDSFLHVTSDALALPGPSGEGSAEAAQARALHRLLDQGAYDSPPEPTVFVYQMREEGRAYTGIIAGVDLAGFADGRVLGHERVQAERVEGLARHYQRVELRSELVALFHRDDPAVTELTARVCATPALLEFTDALGVEQSVWRASPEDSAALARQLDNNRHFIAEGHHRVAAALRHGATDQRPETRTVLCALYPQDQVSLHAFHRRVHGPVATPQLLDALESDFDVRRAAGPEADHGSVGLYAADGWYLLTATAGRRSPGVAGLDVTLLDDRVLGPLLQIRPGDPRLEFHPDLRDLGPLMRACDEDGGVLFTLRAPRLRDLIAVAQRGEVMSAKTTYVRPKPRSGIFLL